MGPDPTNLDPICVEVNQELFLKTKAGVQVVSWKGICYQITQRFADQSSDDHHHPLCEFPPHNDDATVHSALLHYFL
jgi:hypothetical protein